MVHVPDCCCEPHGSNVVFAIAIPVSNPTWLVTNGNNRFVVHWTMLNRLAGVDAASENRGIVSVADAATPAEAENAPCVAVGAKLSVTVAGVVVAGGLLAPGLAVYVTKKAKSKFSTVDGLVFKTSQTAS